MNNGFIQFGDGEPIPVTDVHIEYTRGAVPAVPQFLPLNNYSVTFTGPISSWATSGLLRIVGEEAAADRIDIAAHPDLAELNVMMDGFYGDDRAGTP